MNKWDVPTWDNVKQTTRNETSEKYNEQVKIFLDELQINTTSVKTKTFQIIHNVLIDLRLPEPGEQLRIRTQQQINMISVILKMIDAYKIIDELTIATYTLNKESFGILRDLFESERIKEFNLLLASSYSFRESDYLDQLKRQMKQLGSNAHLTLAWSHFKITLARCGGNYYQLEGSMNYSTNNMAEQLLFENNEELYQQDYQFINGLMKSQSNQALEHVC